MTDQPHIPSDLRRQAARALRGGWLELRGADHYLLTRRWPARFDLAASARFPAVRRGRLARQIRQDLWRALKGLRGFSPVILIDATQTGLTVTAGGQISGQTPVSAKARSAVQTLLDDPAHRARWIAWAQGGAA